MSTENMLKLIEWVNSYTLADESFECYCCNAWYYCNRNFPLCVYVR